MIGSRMRQLSPTPARLAGLLLLAALSAACVAPVGGEGGDPGNAQEQGLADNRPATSGGETDSVGLQDTETTEQTAPSNSGPIDSPIPSPWAPSSPVGHNSTDVVAAPLPSPWANSGPSSNAASTSGTPNKTN